MSDRRSLELFLQLAQLRHFGRAAAAGHLSPSALSRQIRRLEEAFGVRLFERDNRRVELTAAGHRVQRHAEEILRRYRDLEADLQAHAGALRGELRLYASVTAAHRLLAGLLQEWRRRQPGVDITLHTGDEAQAIPRVLAGEDDAAIAARPARLPARLRFQQLDSTPLVFIAPLVDGPALDALQGGDAGIDWSAVPMIVPESGEARRAVEDWFRQRSTRLRAYAHIAGNEAIVSMVALGFGVGIVPLLVLDSSPLASRVRIVDVDQPPRSYSIGLCTLRRRQPDPVVEAFWSVAGDLRRAG
jgi:LysR family positive regulator for ilvC